MSHKRRNQAARSPYMRKACVHRDRRRESRRDVRKRLRTTPTDDNESR